MKRSKPSIVVGGGEMNRATSSVVSMANSEAASDTRISRSVTRLPVSTGSPVRQSVVTTDSGAICGTSARAASISGVYGILSITAPPR